MSYNSKYTGAQVEETLDAVKDKVDKVAGKQLTTEDFTTALKQKLEGLSNYDDTAVNTAIGSLQTQINTLVSGDANTAIESFNEIIAFLSGIEDSESLDSIIASIEQQIAAKQETIADLATIREGAGKGATAVQPSSLAKVATSGSYADLSGKPTIPTTLAGLTDDSTHRTVTDTEKATWNAKSNFSGSYNDLTNKPTIPAEQVNADWNATSGKAQILNKPTIPAAVTVDTALSTTSTNPVQNKAVATGINAKYTKPSAGIPKSDLADDVQTSLGKADTALQTEQYKGTITGVRANGTSVATSGVADIPAASTSRYGVTQLSSSTSSSSTTLAATPSAVKAAYDLANSKQATLVSGTNIKTINGQSILGSGDLPIAVGGDSGEIGIDSPSPTIQNFQGVPMAAFTPQPGRLTIISTSGVESSSQGVIVDFADLPQNEYDGNGGYVEDAKWAHYHLVIYGGTKSMPLAIGSLEAVGGSITFPNNDNPTIEPNSAIEVDVIAGKTLYGGHIMLTGFGLFTRLY